jgi:hypothetical protein
MALNKIDVIIFSRYNTQNKNNQLEILTLVDCFLIIINIFKD